VPQYISDSLVWISVGATVVVAVALIRLFYDFRAFYFRKQYKQDKLFKSVPGIDKSNLMKIHLKDGKLFENVRLVGVIDTDLASEIGLPHPLSNMVAFERKDGSRVWVDAQAIRVIDTIANDENKDI
jgi:hypothetical protein